MGDANVQQQGQEQRQAQDQGPTGSPLLNPDGTWAEGWLQHPLVPEELRTNVQLATHKSITDTLNNWGSLHKRAGMHMLPIPAEGAEDSAYDEVYKALGRPGEPGQYRLPDPVDGAGKPIADRDKMPPEMLQEVLGVLHQAGVSQRQLDRILPGWNALIAKQLNTADEQKNLRMAPVREEMGASFQANQALVEKFLRSHVAPDDLREALNVTTIPTFFRLLHRIATEQAEANPETGEPVPGDVVATAQTEVEKLKADPAYTDRYNPNHKRIVAQVNELQKVVFAAQERQKGAAKV